MTQRNSIGKLFALDVGKKTIGIAVSDPDWKVASPVSILYRRKFTPDMEKLIQMASEHDIGGMVVGWPPSRDEDTGFMTIALVVCYRSLGGPWELAVPE